MTSLAESKENHSGLTQEIMALDLDVTQNTPKRMSIHPTPERRKNPLKGVLKKRYFIFVLEFYLLQIRSGKLNQLSHIVDIY